MRRCTTKNCRREAAKQKRYCYRCNNRRWREANPMRYAWNTQRLNAKRRGKPYYLSFEQFEQWALANDYLNKKGIHKGEHHCDRVINRLGYLPGNLQLLEASENSAKADKEEGEWKPYINEEL